MSNREKGAWVELIALIAIWGFYFASLIGSASAIETEGFSPVMGLRFAICAVLSILAGSASGLLVDLLSRGRRSAARDEREAWAGLRATRIAHGALIVLIFCLATLALLLGAFAGETIAGQVNAALSGFLGNGLVLFANAALAILVLAELVHYAALIVFLRRG